MIYTKTHLPAKLVDVFFCIARDTRRTIRREWILFSPGLVGAGFLYGPLFCGTSRMPCPTALKQITASYIAMRQKDSRNLVKICVEFMRLL